MISDKTKILFVIFLLCFQFVYSQEILFDDIIPPHSGDEWSYLLDTLSVHGATIHFVSDEGWDNLMNMDMVWIESSLDTFPTNIKTSLIDFCRQGGNIIIGDLIICPTSSLNNFLCSSDWQTGMQILDSSYFEFDTQINDFFSISPLTDNIDSIELCGPRRIICNGNCYPLAFLDSDNLFSVVTISYPFANNDNCGSFIVLITGTHAWENTYENTADNFRFAKNILLATAGVSGYELLHCAKPEPYMLEIDSIPNCILPSDTICLTGEYMFPNIKVIIGDSSINPFYYSSDSSEICFTTPELDSGYYNVDFIRLDRILYTDSILIPCPAESTDTTIDTTTTDTTDTTATDTTLEINYLCSRTPNPFTPNSDTENDYTYFTFDGIGEKEATIYIYDMHSILVREIDVPAGANAKTAARWNGLDKNRRSLPQGLYLYVIECNGEVVCKGTVTLAR
ncbi:gliding motility-associated C-terminal domain-containing protein [bacterium]|nr:gliding motility-associated C-terminal domain-containing protein [bacterium]